MEGSEYGTGAGGRPSPPSSKYCTIRAEPPWTTNQVGSRGAARHYPLMSVEEISSLRVEGLAANDAHLWLWVTNSNISEGITVMEAWGFTYKSVLTWIKPYIRLGQY